MCSFYCNTPPRWMLFTRLYPDSRYEMNFCIASLGRGLVRMLVMFSDNRA